MVYALVRTVSLSITGFYVWIMILYLNPLPTFPFFNGDYFSMSIPYFDWCLHLHLFEDKVIDPSLDNNYKRTIKSVQYLLNPPRSESKNDVAALHNMFLSCVKDTYTLYDLNVRLLYFSILSSSFFATQYSMFNMISVPKMVTFDITGFKHLSVFWS